MRNKLFIFISVLFFLSCGNHEEKKIITQKERVFPQYHFSLDSIIISNDGVLRGINLNFNADSIKKREIVPAIEGDNNRLYYEYVINKEINYSLEYSLLNDSLEEVSLQVNCNDLDLTSKIYSDLKDYYEKKLPNPMEDHGQVVYNCFEGQRKPFVISLSDNSTPVKGIINLYIYKDK